MLTRKASVGVVLLGHPPRALSVLSDMLALLGGDRRGGSQGVSPVRGLNDELLSALGSHREDWSALDPRRVNSAAAGKRAVRALDLLRHDFAASPLLVVDDPVISRFPAFWLDLLREFSVDPISVLLVCDPRPTVGAPGAGEEDPSTGSDLLWIRHTLDAEAATRGSPRLVVAFEDLMADWRRVCSRLSEVSGLDWPRRTVVTEAEVDQYLLDRSHRVLDHARHPARSAPLPDTVESAYDAMRSLARQGDDQALRARLDAVRADFERSIALFGPALCAEELVRGRAEAGSRALIRSLRETIERQSSRLQVAASRLAAQSLEAAQAAAYRLFDADWYLSRYPDIAEGGTDPLAHFLAHGWAEGRNPCLLFDTAFYLVQAPDLSGADCSPLVHYLAQGAALGLDPHPLFDTSWYLEQNPELAQAPFNPLVHYIEEGAAQGRDPHPLFDTSWYLEQSPDLADARRNPLVHFLQEGAARGCAPHPLFDTAWYLMQNPEVADGGLNPLVHFVQQGAAQGLAPHRLFDAAWYVGHCADAAASGVNPLVHYLRRRAAKGCDPNPLFDSAWYLAQHPDVAASGVNPLVHYVRFGAAQGLDPSPGFDMEWYLAQVPGLDLGAIDPLAHYIEYGRLMGLFTNAESRAITLPLQPTRLAEGYAERIAVFAHLHYEELVWEFLVYFSHIPWPFDLYISTDTDKKRRRIQSVFSGSPNHAVVVDCRVTPNRGRDWGPLLAEFRDEVLRHEIICHVHSKRSSHFSFGESWRRYLFDAMLGNAQIVQSIRSIFDDNRQVGLLFPETYPGVSEHHVWGSNRDNTRGLLQQLGLDPSIVDTHPLEFPAGSMFWCRSAALRPLLESGLSWEDFPPEPIGEDGTLLHAIERALMYIALSQGFLVEQVRAPFPHGLGQRLHTSLG